MTTCNCKQITDKALGVVILGAGASSRMGRPKLLLPWRGTTVIGAILRQWRELGAAQIAVVLRPGDAPLAAELDRLDFPRADRIENPQPERGMFSSIVCAANWPGWQKGNFQLGHRRSATSRICVRKRCGNCWNFPRKTRRPSASRNLTGARGIR